MKAPKRGRPSVYRDKNLKRRLTCVITDSAWEKIDRYRAQIAKASGIEHVSDGDVVIAMAKGIHAAIEDIRQRRKMART